MQALRQFSLVNVRINAAPAFEACQVDIDNVASYMGRNQSKLASLFGLLFRRSSCQHPLLAAALGGSVCQLFCCLDAAVCCWVLAQLCLCLWPELEYAGWAVCMSWHSREAQFATWCSRHARICAGKIAEDPVSCAAIAHEVSRYCSSTMRYWPL